MAPTRHRRAFDAALRPVPLGFKSSSKMHSYELNGCYDGK